MGLNDCYRFFIHMFGVDLEICKYVQWVNKIQYSKGGQLNTTHQTDSIKMDMAT
jgi:hypothetical protein